MGCNSPANLFLACKKRYNLCINHASLGRVSLTSTIVTRNTGRTGRLRTTFENQAILEPILLYWASKCKQAKKQGSEDCLRTHVFTFFIRLLSAFFSSLCQDAKKTRSNCAITGCSSSKKHKLTLNKTQNGDSNYVDQKVFL